MKQLVRMYLFPEMKIEMKGVNKNVSMAQWPTQGTLHNNNFKHSHSKYSDYEWTGI